MDLAIVILAYNKPHSISRLLNSLSKLNCDMCEVKLYIAIDGGGSDEVINICEKFHWPFGLVEIVKQNVNIGLKNHVYTCMRLGFNHDVLVILEDDLFVAEDLVNYVRNVYQVYSKNTTLAGFSLYSPDFNETAYLPFSPFVDGFDNYFLKVPSSWGLFLTKQQVSSFFDYLDLHSGDYVRLPPNVSRWSNRSWKKDFFRYMISKDKYFHYPRTSLTTNFADAGVHHKGSNVFQVPLLISGISKYRFSLPEDSNCFYDEYCEIDKDCLKKMESSLSDYDFEVDLYGFKRFSDDVNRDKYFISTLKGDFVVKKWSSSLTPPEMNIIQNLDGDDIYLSAYSRVSRLTRIFDRLKMIMRYHNIDLSMSFLSRLLGRS